MRRLGWLIAGVAGTWLAANLAYGWHVRNATAVRTVAPAPLARGDAAGLVVIGDSLAALWEPPAERVAFPGEVAGSVARSWRAEVRGRRVLIMVGTNDAKAQSLGFDTAFEAGIEALLAGVMSGGATCVAVTTVAMPARKQLWKRILLAGREGRAVPRVNAALQAAAARRGAVVVEIGRALGNPPRPALMRDDVHWNAKGQARVRRLVAATMAENCPRRVV